MASVFEFKEYKSYLRSRLEGKGAKAAFAKRIGCLPSFLSQVLGGKPSLSLEQGVLANDALAHSATESRHFLALLQLGRAGSARLRQHFQNEIKTSLTEHRRLSERVEPAQELSESTRATYYSSWVYGAAHVMASIPRADQLAFLTEHTGLAREELEAVLTFLLRHGLLSKDGSTLRPSQRRIHLPGSDPLVMNHHRNLRARAMQEMQVPNADNLHYSLLMAISKADGAKIHDMILQLVENADKVIRPSPEEAAFQFNVDFFEI